MSGVRKKFVFAASRGLPALLVSAACMFSSLAGAPRAEAALYTSTVNVSQTPLFLGANQRPNVLLLVANSNSMDEDASGLAVGSAAFSSRSEIARRVAKNLVATYQNSINMGLMAFQQVTSGGNAVTLMNLHSSPYDVSYNPADWDPTYTGPRDAATKRFRSPNPTSPGNYIYFNVNLPFYAGANYGNAFCHSPTADAFNNQHLAGVEQLWGGVWDTYRCFTQKVGTSNALPIWGDWASEAAAGYGGGYWGAFSFFPTDSDLGQGITDFGRFMTWNWTSQTWFSNGSPGKGYIHVPIGLLDGAKAAAMNVKLGTSQFAVNGPFNSALPLQNAGLTPLEGSLQTAQDYFDGGLATVAEGGPLAAPPESCGKDFVVILTNGLPSVKANGTPSADVTTMLAEATAAAEALHDDGVLTYIVGFALPFGANPAQLDTIAAAGGTGASYYATDEATLQTKLNEVFADILLRSGAASALAMNSSSVSSTAKLYQARFDAGWAGQLLSYSIDSTTGEIATTPNWDAGAILNTLDHSTDRRMITYKPSNGKGVPFRWPSDPLAPTTTEIDTTQTSALHLDISSTADGRGAQRLSYIRGDKSLEGANPTTQFRPRSRPLGDIVNSAPVYVGGAQRNPADVSYQTFRNSALVTGRPAMIYVGANDGALHGFDAVTGIEKLAYVPAAVYSNLSKLTAQSYTHRYFVDGSPAVDDAKIGSGSTWRTILASGLGAGGRAIFALDITDPASFSEANADDISLWEFSSSTDADLGLTMGEPVIAKMNDGSWAVIAGNGVNNTGSGQSGIFILNAATGAVKRKIMTGLGNNSMPNGITNVTAVDLDGNMTVDVAYAGDLYGRMWKFDLTSTNPAGWSVAFSGSPLFHAENSGDDQPITSAAEVTKHPNGSGVLVMFGTGMYMQLSDITNTEEQSIYGIWDNGTGEADEDDLLQQTVSSTFTESGELYRRMSNNAINWAVHRGWFLNLPTAGERVVSNPIVRNGRLIANTMVPASGACEAGGYSWLMELSYKTGGRITVPVLDTNKDGLIDSSDSVAGGVKLSAISSTPAILGGFGDTANPDSLENKYMNQSTGALRRVLETADPLANRRMSWRQIQ